MPSNKRKVDLDLVEQLCSIADISKTIATNLLEACNNDIEMAINMHMEDASTNANGPCMGSEDEVRAPIPQRQEILVEGPDQISYSLHGRKRAATSVFDKFRDFQAETKRQEEELLEEGNRPGSSRSKSAKRKIKTLEDLFRPPLDLMFRGSFQSARDNGIASKKWLLVNVQNSSEFACQVLNRDVWSNSAVKSIIQEHFLFWQIYHDSVEGLRYMNFYPVREWPYIAIVDPRTGECMISFKKLDALSFCEIVTEFLSSRSFLDDSISSPTNKKPKVDQIISEYDEASQIEAAIKASLESQNVEEDSDELETFSPEPQAVNSAFKAESESEPSESPCSPPTPCTSEEPTWKQHLGNESDPISNLILRLPDGSRETVAMPCSSTLMALVLYMTSKGFSNESYEMVTNFPRRRLSYLDFNCSLKAVGLFPQETVFVQKR